MVSSLSPMYSVIFSALIFSHLMTATFYVFGWGFLLLLIKLFCFLSVLMGKFKLFHGMYPLVGSRLSWHSVDISGLLLKRQNY